MTQVVAMAIELLKDFLGKYVERCGKVVEVRSNKTISTLLDLTNLLLVSIYDISSFWVSDFVCSLVWFGGVHSK